MSNQITDEQKSVSSKAFSGSGLFFKFFFWFWLAVVLTGILVATYGYLYHFAPESKRMFRMGREFLEENGQMVVEAYEKSGVETALNMSMPGSCWLFDENLNNLFDGLKGKFNNRRRFDRPPDDRPDDRFKEAFTNREPEIKALARKILDGISQDPEEVGGQPLIGCLIVSESKKKYAIIHHVPAKMPKHRFIIDRLLETMPIFLLVTAFFCFALARYMVKPISELREASRRFAQGDLSARARNGAENRLDEIGDLAIDFNDMADKIETMIRGQRRLFGDISHELRSPLARLQVSVEILQKKMPETEHLLLARIEKEIARMNEMIEEVLQFSRLETGSYEGERLSVSLHETLQRVCSDADFEGKLKNCNVVLHVANEAQIQAIPQLIDRAIENVLRNAVKHSPNNANIEVNMRTVENNIVISIIDNGPGVPEAEIPKLFSPFYRYQEDRDRKTGGVGLGLAIAERAIKLHKGHIVLRNRPEGGLSAEISLPCA